MGCSGKLPSGTSLQPVSLKSRQYLSSLAEKQLRPEKAKHCWLSSAFSHFGGVLCFALDYFFPIFDAILKTSF